ncbi:hypothetical protein [Absidia glauca]|uniref:t-SNARE coiled-coil homology domain-containing protein n=1 Tax=Absidia glauca TaxID=4829 RepID=A0A163K494_ABSGL|nr:hypothetical protein [Absidia glauca]
MSFNDLEQGHGSSRSSGNNRQGAIRLPGNMIHNTLHLRVGPCTKPSNVMPCVDDDNDDEKDYRALVQKVSQQVFRINGNITSLERLVNFLGGPRDTADVRTKLHDVTEDTRNLIKDATNDIKGLTRANPSRQRKLEQQKLSKDFQKVLGDFQKIQRVSVSKQREYLDKAKATTAMLQSQAAEEEDEGGLDDDTTYIDDTQRRIQLQTLDNEIEYNEGLITEREDEIMGIEQGITELNEIFRDLGTLVNEQDSGIQSIYGNVLNVSQNTRQAADELTTANRHQKNARKNMCCFFLIIAVVASVLALIIVVAK